MSEDYNISYSYSMGKKPAAPVQPPSPGTVDQTLYAFDDCEEVDLPSNAVLLVSRKQPRQIIVTRDVAIALRHCRQFRSIEDHTKFLTAYMPELGGDIASVRNVLTSVRDAGLLTSAATYASLFATRDTATAPAPSRVFVITCDRPQALQRLLESMLGVPELSRHEALFVVDDSRQEANAEENRAHVDSFNRHSSATLQYFGAAERNTLLQSLIAELPGQEQSLRFLLDQSRWQGQETYGLSRTVCLLLSVGRRAVLLDDDIVCTAIDSPYTLPGAQFYDGMSEADFYPSAESWSRRYPPRSQDPLAGHLTCLGLGLADALHTLGVTNAGEQTLADSHGDVLRNLSADSAVLVTQNGTFGDPGTENASWCFSLEGDSLARLLDNPAQLQARLSSHHYWLGWSRPTFSSQASMSQMTGLDNTALLPPYFPAWRGEDQVFGAMVKFLHPDSVALNYPWAVPHLPLEARQGETDKLPDSAGMGVVENFLCENTPREQSLPFNARLRTLVQLLRNVAEQSDSDLGGMLRTAVAAAQADTIRSLSEQLRQAPEDHLPWRTTLEARLQRYFAAVSRADAPLPLPGLARGLPEEEVWDAVREYYASFATCLEDWPAIRAAAAGLTRQGMRSNPG